MEARIYYGIWNCGKFWVKSACVMPSFSPVMCMRFCLFIIKWWRLPSSFFVFDSLGGLIFFTMVSVCKARLARLLENVNTHFRNFVGQNQQKTYSENGMKSSDKVPKCKRESALSRIARKRLIFFHTNNYKSQTNCYSLTD